MICITCVKKGLVSQRLEFTWSCANTFLGVQLLMMENGMSLLWLMTGWSALLYGLRTIRVFEVYSLVSLSLIMFMFWEDVATRSSAMFYLAKTRERLWCKNEQNSHSFLKEDNQLKYKVVFNLMKKKKPFKKTINCFHCWQCCVEPGHHCSFTLFNRLGGKH